MRNPVRLPSLNALRAFEAAARHDTLQGAADELHVTHGAVSRQVRQLEDELGEELFTRQARTNILNDRGRALATKLHDVFQDLAQALEEFHRDGIIPPLSISCEPTLCLKMLIPALGELKRETGLDVKVFAAGGPIDFEKDRIDLAIRREDFRVDQGLHLYPLSDEATGPVVAPMLVADGKADTLFKSVQLHTLTRPDAWKHWLHLTGVKRTRASKLTFEHFYLALQAAQAGQGAAVASVFMAAGDIEAGLLVAPRRFTRDGTRYVCLSSANITQDDRKRTFCAWLANRMNRTLEKFVERESVAEPRQGT